MVRRDNDKRFTFRMYAKKWDGRASASARECERALARVEHRDMLHSLAMNVSAYAGWWRQLDKNEAKTCQQQQQPIKRERNAHAIVLRSLLVQSSFIRTAENRCRFAVVDRMPCRSCCHTCSDRWCERKRIIKSNWFLSLALAAYYVYQVMKKKKMPRTQ